MKNLKLPALTAALLLTAATFTAAHAQVVSQDDASVYFDIDAGSANMVDFYIDGALTVANARTGDDIGVTTLTPGQHDIVVKSSYGGNILSTSTINVSGGNWYTVALAAGPSSGNYALSFESGF
ncbi:DUF4397 domain-containing protein [Deinococcus sp. Arct2-2]|uniref:DUF4397 domain-containing protein n=1 Tax=Deinococcus sp. Arct2-2 TaxID=2568653 RepID=UPI0010A47A77|nr:DUF4397 domain-containing protein [Deinococcus sp. Arct2-2]THF69831.1 DUF4397 domain-containing protein [Deinococcus sp. Arct2-2]